MIRVGLTGGMASGKSVVARHLAELGARVVAADQIARELMLPGGAAFQPVIDVFGREIVNQEGLIDRSKLAAMVFGDEKRLRTLESIVHPHVFRAQDEIVAEYAEANPDGVAVIEAAILVEAGSWKRCDRVVLCWCRPEQQVERAMARDRISEEQVRERMARQMPFLEKRRYADYIVDTSGSMEWTKQQTSRLYERLKEESKQL